jgi:hypothetical protein
LIARTRYALERIAADPKLALAEDDPRLAPLERACKATGAT